MVKTPTTLSSDCVCWLSGERSLPLGYFFLFPDVDECSLLRPRCENGATCLNVLGGYKCVCAPGYTGTNCENDFNECLDSPCLNGGTCVNTFGSFTCMCPSYYKGLRCEIYSPSGRR